MTNLRHAHVPVPLGPTRRLTQFSILIGIALWPRRLDEPCGLCESGTPSALVMAWSLANTDRGGYRVRHPSIGTWKGLA